MRLLALEEKRQYQIKILDTIDSYCREHDLKYFLIAGTLLGAVRHKGYIPWDDDIDICMPRNDYEKLVNEFNVSGYYVVSPEIKTEGFFFPFAKVCLKNTKIDESSKTLKAELGINVDVFPIDIVLEDNRARKKQLAKIAKLRHMLDVIDTPMSKGRRWYKNLALAIFQFILFPVSPRRIVSRIVAISKAYNEEASGLCGEIAWGCGEKEIVNKSVFENTVRMSFEGKKYSCPIGWDEWLSKRYGDYMKLPPMEQQKTHHDCNAYILEEK